MALRELLPLDSLPLGFRFRPPDKELINHYLRLKITGRHKEVWVIREIVVCKCEPWDLSDNFYFSAIKKKVSKWTSNESMNQAMNRGYWKSTGKDHKIKSWRNVIGMKKTLVLYTGHAPAGKRTNWIMHEYYATLKKPDGTHPGRMDTLRCASEVQYSQVLLHLECTG